MALIVFAGLPGVGKTTLARALAQAEGALHVRVDSIEQAMRDGGGGGEDDAGGDGRGEDDVGPRGYLVAYAVARDNLALGRVVVADGVNPVAATREAWRAVAASTGAPLLEVEIVCSDAAEHRRRVETRAIDIPGLAPPDWAATQVRLYESWDTPPLVIDTAGVAPQAALDSLRASLRALAAR
jgi:predicted kinase